MRLKSLSFVDTAVKGSLDGEISIIALNTSLVLLAAITTSPSRNVVLMLWDLQFSVLLSSQVLSIPSALSTLPKLYISLRPTQMSSHAILVVSPPPSAEVSKSARSTIYAIPLVVPKMSTISMAMGRASAGSQWTVQDNEDEEPTSGKGKILQQVRESLSKNDIKAAEQAFFDWEAAQTKTQESTVEFGHTLVRDLLLVALQPTKANSAYPSRIVHSLLRQRVVSAGMIEEAQILSFGLPSMQAAMILCMDHVTDLEESDLVSTLQSVTESSRQSQGSDAMQVDSATPSLSAFLRSCVTYRCSPAALRTALNRHLKQPDDVVLLLETLDGWLGSRKGAEVVALPSRKSVRKNEDGVSVLQQGAKDLELPLPKILSFAQTLIDATFLTLLQHTAAHAILRRLLAHIEPEISLTEQVDSLRGPLGVFAQAQAKARRRAAFDRAEMAVGIYQVEEIVL
ncbi:unnamed protein product [Mycena citricolor]|uniref:Uncharacterized protein n=1 Tax=Mycena citricolor TaxID=2018698 RepID=A0AAD2K566_9AGAR|nr:unnamed protein product [Mycena citricolor]